MQTQNDSSRKGRGSGSFSVRDITLHDLLSLLFPFVFLTLLNLAAGWLPVKLLSGKWLWIWCGFIVGLSVGIWLCQWSKRRSSKNSCELSPEVRAMAENADDLTAAAKQLTEEYPNIGLAAAKDRVEEFQKMGR